MSITVSLLRAYYLSVWDLRTYLGEILEPTETGHDYLMQEGDPLPYESLLMKSYVGLNVDLKNSKRLATASPMVHMREIIDRAQERLFAKAKGRPSNVITTGYRSASRNGERGKIGMSRIALTNYFVNTIVTALQAPEWEILFGRIGEDAMFHLLTETSIFISLPNECLCQMTGEPIIHLKPPSIVSGIHEAQQASAKMDSKVFGSHRCKRKPKEPHPDERPAKLLRRNDSASSCSSVVAQTAKPHQISRRHTPADITFVRSRMFYSWPHFVPHASNIAVGLPPKHILNRIEPSYQCKPKARPGEWVDPDPRQQAGHARHLAKYVFPRQYGLSNPFLVPTLAIFQANRLPDYSDREEEIKKIGPCKTPKRLKQILEILEKMTRRHGKCGYKASLEITCPSKIKSDKKTTLDSSIILNLMSEYSSQLRSQATMVDTSVSVDSSGRPIFPHGLSQAQKQLKNKPRFVEFACSYTEVYRYAALVTNAVIPRAFWGCEKNRKLVLRNIKFFIIARRYESTTLHNILQGFSVTECDWLAPSKMAAHPRVCVTDALKRRELLEDFLFWYFDSFLLPLLKTTFYVTESSAYRRRVLYFRQDDWSTLCKPLIEKLSSETFQRIEQHEAAEILRQRKLGFSFVRLLPKETGVRPIVNLRRRKVARKGHFDRPEQSINQVLQAAFQILTYEKENQPNLLGASVFGSNEIYSRLKAFKSHLLQSGQSGRMPKLYFVKVDVQACFDTIEQTKLLEILRELISEDTYMIQRYGQVNCVGSKVRRKYAKRAQPEDDHPHFLSFAAQLAKALRHTIFVDQVVYPFSQKQDIIALLEEHITENIVKIGEDYFHQVVGIPQGSVLSALLCSFFYGDLERRRFKFTSDPQCVLLRMIDDYLFITTSLPSAKQFLTMMMQGHPDYGCFISKDKTLVNFEYDILTNITEPHQQNFPWCGYMINMTDLSVSADYSRYHESYLQDSLTVDLGRHVGVTFVHKMLQLTKSKSHIIYCDADLNSPHTIYLNIYQNFMISAMKMHHYLCHWGLDTRKNFTFIHNTVRQMIRYTYTAMQNKASNRVAKASGGHCEAKQIHVFWLGTCAFHTVLSRKIQRYQQLIKALEFELALPRYRGLKKQFRDVVKEGLATLALLAF
ncbi:hypothetical protein AcV7_006436 [Taiwanofungus camphoratus]|nr:hypothetical protein AcV7_006436 [Antrodia cinnamomea]